MSHNQMPEKEVWAGELGFFACYIGAIALSCLALTTVILIGG